MTFLSEIDKSIGVLMSSEDCFGLQEHKVLTLNTVYKMPIEEPSTNHWKMVKDFGESCFREGWIHCASILNNNIKSLAEEKIKALKKEIGEYDENIPLNEIDFYKIIHKVMGEVK